MDDKFKIKFKHAVISILILLVGAGIMKALAISKKRPERVAHEYQGRSRR